MYQSINPRTGKTFSTQNYHTQQDIEKALQKTEAGRLHWSNLNFKERASHIRRIAELLRMHINRLADTVTAEMGKLSTEAHAEIHKSADALDYYALKAESLLQDEVIATDFEQSSIHYQPLGCILGIMPWNYPIWQVIRFIAPTLMAGNVVLLKHAENVPQCAMIIEQFFKLAELPDGIFQNLFIDETMTAEIIADSRCSGVSLTGSTQAGSAVAAIAGKYIKKSVLELGGSDAFIVLEDADLEKAAITAAKSRYMNAGQTCIAAKRFIVHQDIADQFVEKLQQQAALYITGDIFDSNTSMAPMARNDLRDKLHEQVEESIKRGATVISGCIKPDSHADYPASILDNVSKDMPAYNEELFGPVACIIRAESNDAAIKIANDTHYGLAASVWSQNIATATDIAKQLNVGGVFINSLVKSDVRLPFGGIKQSGYGRELAQLGMREFVNAKTMVIEN